MDDGGRANLIFASVFPELCANSTPTPFATPEVGFTDPAQSFGGFQGSSSQYEGTAVELEVKRSRAWSSATRYLSALLAASFTSGPSLHAARTKEVDDALEYLLLGEGYSDGEDNLVRYPQYFKYARLTFHRCRGTKLRSATTFWTTLSRSLGTSGQKYVYPISVRSLLYTPILILAACNHRNRIPQNP